MSIAIMGYGPSRADIFFGCRSLLLEEIIIADRQFARVALSREGFKMHSTDPVNSLMTTPVLTVDINDPAGEMLRLFAGYPVHHLPVLDNQKVVGMLSSADVMKLELFLPKSEKSPIEYLNQRMKVAALVRRPALCIQPHESVETAAQMMAKHGVHALAVVNAHDDLLGIITTTDIICAALGGQKEGPAQGIAAAAPQAGTDRDPDVLPQGLAQMQARIVLLEQVRDIANRFVQAQAGQNQQLQSALVKALQAVSRAEQEGDPEPVKRA